VPRQQRRDVDGQRRLRLHRPGAVRARDRVRRLLPEYDDARSGSFEPLAGAPDDKQVVLGLVSTKTPELETTEQLQARIDEAARFFPREQLGLSTQCGFASIVAGNPIAEQDEERKLRLVAETAHAVWA
jgi:5-methyltetrahydropteroyltriglutamate--homocysteine methyltransferase